MRSSGDWSITAKAVPVRKAEEALARLLPKNRSLSTISKPTISEGVRVGHHWLGRPSVLPIITTDAGPIRLVHAGASDEPVCEDVEGRPNVYAIKSGSPLDGLYALQMASSASTPLRFVRNSLIHAGRRSSNGIPIQEWTAVTYMVGRNVAPALEWQVVSSGVDDLLEAIYAGGRSGWNESELVPLLERLLPARINPWDFLRSLHDSSLLSPSLRAQFRGRVWTLRDAEMVSLRTTLRDVVVVDGSLSALLTEDFRAAVSSMGGQPFRLVPSEWSVPLLGATGIDVSALSSRLGWKQSRALMPADRPLALSETERRLDPYDAASFWSWDLGRFALHENRSPVRLTRWVHRGGRDHDIYEVVSGARTRRFLSRAAAIVYAHSLAKRSLYQAEGNKLTRKAKDGFLPDAVARWLRYANLLNPSFSMEGEYSYPVQHGQSATIAAIIPGAIDAGVTTRPIDEIVCSVRRSGWTERMVWKETGLSAGRAPFGPAARSTQ
jgi:hypothetical protein